MNLLSETRVWSNRELVWTRRTVKREHIIADHDHYVCVCYNITQIHITDITQY